MNHEVLCHSRRIVGSKCITTNQRVVMHFEIDCFPSWFPLILPTKSPRQTFDPDETADCTGANKISSMSGAMVAQTML